jgi:peroxin-7
MNRGPPPSQLHTPGFAHYAVKWSPFRDTQLAVASSANFGLIGNGRLHVVSAVPGAPALQLNKWFETQDGLYDLAWSEVHENHIVTASGDGSVRLWDIALN